MQNRQIKQQTETAFNEETVKKASRGDKKAMAMIVEEYEGRVYGLAFKFAGNQHDAEEILQETFIKVFKNLSGFKGNSSFSTWLYRIASNQAIDIVAKKKAVAVTFADSEINDPVFFDWTKRPETIALLNEKNEVLNKLVTDLPPKLKIAFILKDIEQLPYEEVAAALSERSINTVKTRVHRARLILRDKLTGYLMEN